MFPDTLRFTMDDKSDSREEKAKIIADLLIAWDLSFNEAKKVLDKTENLLGNKKLK